MTHRVNLTPVQLTAGRRATRAVGVWAVVSIAAGIAGGLFCSWTWLDARAGLSDLNTRLDEATRAAAEAAAPIEKLDARAKDLRRRIAVADRLRARPDWSVLLRLVNAARRDEVQLEFVEFAPALPGTEPDRVTAVRVSIQGLAPSASSALGYATRLQDSGAFDALPAPRTGERAVGSDQRIAFQIEGRIGTLPPNTPRAEASQ
jgi:hypothetical protein